MPPYATRERNISDPRENEQILFSLHVKVGLSFKSHFFIAVCFTNTLGYIRLRDFQDYGIIALTGKPWKIILKNY